MAPIWTMPAVFFTCPRMSPASAGGPWAQAESARQTMPASNPAAVERVRRFIPPCSRFLQHALDASAHARRLGKPLVYVTEKLADGVKIWLRFLSTTFIFS